jgi:hypothetical protein
METGEQKLFRLADKAAREAGLTLTLYHYSDGSGTEMRFEDADSFEAAAEVIHGTRQDHPAETWQRVQAALAKRAVSE